jgi:hypothetical protein
MNLIPTTALAFATAVMPFAQPSTLLSTTNPKTFWPSENPKTFWPSEDIYLSSNKYRGNTITSNETIIILEAHYPRFDLSHRPQNRYEHLIPAFHEIDLDYPQGITLIRKAEEILSEANFSKVSIVPALARDLEEDVTYLTLQLHVDADFETAMKLDFLLTEKLISAFRNIPTNLSFAVYEKI